VKATPVPSVGSSLSASLLDAGIKVSWPPSYVGWILQTNIVGLANTGAWGDVPESLTHSEMTFPSGGPAEYFRLRHP